MTRVQRIPPTQDELDAMLRKHLSFEINRFRATATLWDSRRYGELADAMVRESCLIHMRLLLDFFYPRLDPKKSKHQDVFVSDYLPNPNSLSPEFQALLAEPSWLRDYRDQLDWRLVHLTTRRIDFERQPMWNPNKQFAHLESLIGEFLNALPPITKALFDPNRQ